MKFAVLKQWKLGVPCAPTGMGIDEKRSVALLGCSDPSIAYTLEWDLAAGHQVRILTEIGGADQVVYDPTLDVYLVAGLSNGVTAIGFFGGTPISIRSVKLTHADARAVAIDDRAALSSPRRPPRGAGLGQLPVPAPA